jgi:hypothetical protein
MDTGEFDRFRVVSPETRTKLDSLTASSGGEGDAEVDRAELGVAKSWIRKCAGSIRARETPMA